MHSSLASLHLPHMRGQEAASSLVALAANRQPRLKQQGYLFIGVLISCSFLCQRRVAIHSSEGRQELGNTPLIIYTLFLRMGHLSPDAVGLNPKP